MFKYLLAFIAVLTVALGVQPVLAGDHRVYVGETPVTTLPGIGIVALHDLCDSEFPGARMCSTSEFMNNGVGEDAMLPVFAAWIRPSLVAGAADGFLLDESGIGVTSPGALIPTARISDSQGIPFLLRM